MSVDLEDAAMEAASVTLDRDGCDWPDLRRAVLAYGGIGPSRDFPRDWVPGDLYRANGRPPDLVAAEACADAGIPAPWGDTGDDSAMMAHLRRSFATWESVKTRARGLVVHRAAPAAPRRLKPGERSFAELVADLQAKHGADVDLSGLRSEYVKAYESGERITVERDGRTWRGTIGATRGARPRFVLLMSMDL